MFATSSLHPGTLELASASTGRPLCIYYEMEKRYWFIILTKQLLKQTSYQQQKTDIFMYVNIHMHYLPAQIQWLTFPRANYLACF
jgi:hypothetical protein